MGGFTSGIWKVNYIKESLLIVPGTDTERLRDAIIESAFPFSGIIFCSGFHSLCLVHVEFKS